jgi:prepilin-type processing-associated H-X9-DG protein
VCTAFVLKDGTLEAADETGLKLALKRSNREAEKFFQDAKPITAQELQAAREAAYCASCANNLKQLGLICKMFSNESKDRAFPELSLQSGLLMWTADCVYPEYMTDCVVMVCPASSRAATLATQKHDPKSLIDDQSYIYLGYAVTNDEDFSVFLTAYMSQLKTGGKFDSDLTSVDGKIIHRLREGVEHFFVPNSGNTVDNAKIQSIIPVLIERPGNHGSLGNVLYMDGHVETRKCPGEFPYTPTVLDGLKKIGVLRKKGGKMGQ